MKLISFDEFYRRFLSSYAIEVDATSEFHDFSKELYSRGTIFHIFGQVNWFKRNFEKYGSIKIHNGPSDLRLNMLPVHNDEVIEDNGDGSYIVFHERDEMKDTGKQDDDGYPIYRETGRKLVERVRVILLNPSIPS